MGNIMTPLAFVRALKEVQDGGGPGPAAFRALTVDKDEMLAEVARLTADNERLRGAAQADDERLHVATLRAGVLWTGCDAPDMLADAVLEARADNERLREGIDYALDHVTVEGEEVRRDGHSLNGILEALCAGKTWDGKEAKP